MRDIRQNDLAEKVSKQVDTWFDKNSDKLINTFRSGMEEAQLRMIDGMTAAIKKGPLGRIEKIEARVAANHAALAEVCGRSNKTREKLERVVGNVNGLLK